MSDLETDRYYKDEMLLDSYRDAQIKRHSIKSQKTRDASYYEKISEKIISNTDSVYEMICLGTRNNHERECFRDFLNNEFVYSLDIAEDSGSDYICDFNFLPDHWSDKCDVLFSNSIDHAISATDVFFEWIRVVKPNGILVIGFDLTTTGVVESDCNTFTKDSVNSFFVDQSDLVEIVDVIECGYYHVIARKL